LEFIKFQEKKGANGGINSTGSQDNTRCIGFREVDNFFSFANKYFFNLVDYIQIFVGIFSN